MKKYKFKIGDTVCVKGFTDGYAEKHKFKIQFRRHKIEVAYDDENYQCKIYRNFYSANKVEWYNEISITKNLK